MGHLFPGLVGEYWRLIRCLRMRTVMGSAIGHGEGTGEKDILLTPFLEALWFAKKDIDKPA